MSELKQIIMEYAASHPKISWSLLAVSSGMKPTTARQYLSKLTNEKKLVRVGHGEYAKPQKQIFNYEPTEDVKKIYDMLKAELPFSDFCIYDGGILSSIQHHLSVNNAIYVETNRDAIESVFSRLKEKYKDVYRRPDSAFMYDYLDLRNMCVIVKRLVTEAPLMTVDGVRVPTLEKILVDIQKDADFDYVRGIESQYMYQTAFDLYSINTHKLMRYARRRGISQKIQELLNQVNNYD